MNSAASYLLQIILETFLLWLDFYTLLKAKCASIINFEAHTMKPPSSGCGFMICFDHSCFMGQDHYGKRIHTTIAEFLNRRELDSVRDAFRMAVYNSRSMHFIDPEAKPELKLSEVY
ncbi:MAG: hypothetical protein ACJAV1_003918 [Paraglaciecola sp.]